MLPIIVRKQISLGHRLVHKLSKAGTLVRWYFVGQLQMKLTLLTPHAQKRQLPRLGQTLHTKFAHQAEEEERR